MWIYQNTKDNSARFILGEGGKRPLICFGVNCSIAEPGNLDPTVKRVQNIAKAEGFDGWIMLNLYPERMTKFEELTKTGNSNFHKQNLKRIRNVFKKYPNMSVWAAWGGLIMKRLFLKKYLKDIVDVVGTDNVKWIHRGHLVGNEGHPHHPLYLKQDAKFYEFDMNKYLKNLE